MAIQPTEPISGLPADKLDTDPMSTSQFSALKPIFSVPTPISGLPMDPVETDPMSSAQLLASATSPESLRTFGTRSFPSMDVTVEVELDEGEGVAKIRLTGPSDAWFGVGIDALTMAETPYAIIVDGSSGTFEERRLGYYEAGESLATSLMYTSPPTRINGKCHVELRRPLAGMGLSPAASALNIMAAVGGSSSFAYHAIREAGEMSMTRL